MKITQGPWTAEYTVGRIADVWHAEVPDHPVDCVQVVDDWFETHRDGTEDEVRAALATWVTEVGPDYSRELGYL